MSLVVVDYHFPSQVETFRDEEFLYYLEMFDAHFFNHNSNINYSMIEKLDTKTGGRFKKNFKTTLAEKYSLAYSLGLYTTHCYYKFFYEKHRIPFVFTLYPGFGFHPFEEEQKNLTELISSPLCRAVIATQPTTVECLKKLNLNHKTMYVNGVVVSKEFLSSPMRCLVADPKIKLCFVAHDSGDGRKGFSEFIDTCDILHNQFPHDFEFHVVGNWPNPRQYVSYHGVRPREYLFNLYPTMDAIVSPTKETCGGEIDGFPTTACLEAAAMGCALIITDSNNQNESFLEDEWMQINTNPQDIAAKIMASKDVIKQIGIRGQNRVKQAYSIERQATPRYNLVRQFYKSQ
jgi:glycosyltransferase involved in cell wall biosynthesis